MKSSFFIFSLIHDIWFSSQLWWCFLSILMIPVIFPSDTISLFRLICRIATSYTPIIDARWYFFAILCHDTAFFQLRYDDDDIAMIFAMTFRLTALISFRFLRYASFLHFHVCATFLLRFHYHFRDIILFAHSAAIIWRYFRWYIDDISAFATILRGLRDDDFFDYFISDFPSIFCCRLRFPLHFSSTFLPMLYISLIFSFDTLPCHKADIVSIFRFDIIDTLRRSMPILIYIISSIFEAPRDICSFFVSWFRHRYYFHDVAAFRLWCWPMRAG